MLIRLKNLWLRDHAAHLAGVQLALAAGLTAGVALAGAPMQPQAGALTSVTAAEPAAAVALVATDADADVIRLQDLEADAAKLWNAANPISALPNPPAKPFKLAAESVLDEARAIDCMTAAVYYEAAYESLDGQRAVAQVVLNRMRHPAYPKTVCGVVFQGSERRTGCQFTFTCDGALNRQPNAERWTAARQVAQAALNGYVMKRVGNATHYHADYVAPYWSPHLLKVATVGAHIFYRWTGSSGLPPAFGGRYAGGETQGVQVAKLDGLAKDEGRLQLAALQQEAPVSAPAAEPAASSVAATAAEVELVTPAEAVAKDAKAITRPDELDWAGRPKAKTPPRLAMPSAGAPF